MRHSQLHAFHHVALSGGFTRAAEALNQSQPALSEQVRRLEQAHDVLLFNRDGRQVTLTERGEALLRLTREYFEHEARIAAFLSESRAALDGTLRIVADSAHHVIQALGRFRRAHPRIRVQLSAGNSVEVLRALRAYEAEVGVLAEPPEAADLSAIQLGRSPVIAIAARDMRDLPDQAMSLHDLAALPLVMREPGSKTRALVEAAARASGLRLKPAIEAEGREAMREIVAAGAGIGFVSEAEAGFDNRLRRLRLDGAPIWMSEYLVAMKARRDVPVIRAFWDDISLERRADVGV